MQDMATLAEAEQEVGILEELGAIKDVDVANVVYTILDVGDERRTHTNYGH